MKKWNLSRREQGNLIAAGILLLFGGVCFSVSGMMFLGYLAVETAALCAAWIPLGRWAKRSTLGRWCKRLITLGVAGVLLIFCVAEGVIISYGERDHAEISADAVIVLGAGINGEEPSPALQTRLNAARNYMVYHPEIPVVLSGGLGLGETVTEAEVMRRTLSTGDPSWDKRLYPEGKATSTAENFRYSCEILREIGIDPEEAVIAVVTNDFHIYRAKLIGARMNVNVVGVPAELPWWWVNATCYVREAFALVKTLIFD